MGNDCEPGEGRTVVSTADEIVPYSENIFLRSSSVAMEAGRFFTYRFVKRLREESPRSERLTNHVTVTTLSDLSPSVMPLTPSMADFADSWSSN